MNLFPALSLVLLSFNASADFLNCFVTEKPSDNYPSSAFIVDLDRNRAIYGVLNDVFDQQADYAAKKEWSVTTERSLATSYYGFQFAIKADGFSAEIHCKSQDSCSGTAELTDENGVQQSLKPVCFIHERDIVGLEF